ncbi:MAG: envelope stress response membrane protein PspC [Gammaproteobacteria bacterium]|nr:envelope stress response membrane protein PspC [Gammaproteobacteria bacterium]
MLKGTLYRNTRRGKLGGVCAGLGDYLGWELWLIRLGVVALTLFSGSVMVLIYVVLWFVLDAKKSSDGASREVKSHVWQAGQPPRQAFKDVVTRFEMLEARLRKMEATVTSREYQLKREIDQLKGN